MINEARIRTHCLFLCLTRASEIVNCELLKLNGSNFDWSNFDTGVLANK